MELGRDTAFAGGGSVGQRGGGPGHSGTGGAGDAPKPWKREKGAGRHQGTAGAVSLFGLALASMLLCWLPGYLAYYPGICAYDITIQMGQVVSGSYGTHHPLAHTLLVGLFAKLGNGLGM